MNDEHTPKEEQLRWGSCFVEFCLGLALVTLVLAACHDARRNNPFDPTLTPPVKLLPVTVDKQQGSATLIWSQYAGDQPFGSYQVVRRIVGEITPQIRATISDRAETTFVDTMVQAEHLYIYNVTTTNTSGLEVPSNVREVFFSFESPQLRVEFDSRAARAMLRWNRSMSGFARYDIQRRAERSEEMLTVRRTTAVDDTTFMDMGLDGNTEYHYTLVTRTTAGGEVESAPVGGKFHAFLREWAVPGQMTGGFAIDPEDRIYVSSTDPNRIYQFTSEGELLRLFPTDPLGSNLVSLYLAADRDGVYSIVAPSFIARAAFYVNGFDPTGERRFRWPPTGGEDWLSGIAVSPDGHLWVAQPSSKETSILYALDVRAGEPVDTLEVQIPIENAMSMGNNVGVAVIPTVDDEAGFGIFDMSTGEVLHRVGRMGSGRGQFNIPVASVSGSHNRLFIVDAGNARIQVFRDGEYLTRWGQAGKVSGGFRFAGPSPFYGEALATRVLGGIAVDSEGNIYVADTFNNRIQVFEP